MSYLKREDEILILISSVINSYQSQVLLHGFSRQGYKDFLGNLNAYEYQLQRLSEASK